MGKENTYLSSDPVKALNNAVIFGRVKVKKFLKGKIIFYRFGHQCIVW